MDLVWQIRTSWLGFFILLNVCVLSVSQSAAQSTLLEFPTPLTTNELSGTIKARDVGDARVTTYYYWFEGTQGDIFVNIVTKNFAGDVDIFVQSGLKPLTKVVVYPDFGEVETGRVIYLRKPERLVVRVQGRTPNDETATYRLKFAGSFVAAAATGDSPEMPKVLTDSVGNVRVNSVGTILPPLPKPVKAEDEETKKTADDITTTEEKTAETKTGEQNESVKSDKEVPKLEVVVTDDIAKEPKIISSAKPAPTARRGRNARRQPVKPKVEKAPPKTDENVETGAAAEVEKKAEESTATTPPAKTKVDPMANFQLVIVFNDGRRIERPMTEVFRFSVDRGVLTVVSKNGRVGRFSMGEITKVSIE